MKLVNNFSKKMKINIKSCGCNRYQLQLKFSPYIDICYKRYNDMNEKFNLTKSANIISFNSLLTYLLAYLLTCLSSSCHTLLQITTELLHIARFVTSPFILPRSILVSPRYYTTSLYFPICYWASFSFLFPQVSISLQSFHHYFHFLARGPQILFFSRLSLTCLPISVLLYSDIRKKP